MNAVEFSRQARGAFAFLQEVDKVTSETGTRSTYLMYLASIHPKEATFDEVEQALGLSKSQVSRLTRTLHKLDRFGEPGLDFVDVTFDLSNPRIKLVKLNDSGLKAVEQLLSQRAQK